MITASTDLSVYQEMNLKSPTIARLAAGEQVEPGKMADRCGWIWMAVTLADGRTGYVLGSRAPSLAGAAALLAAGAGFVVAWIVSAILTSTYAKQGANFGTMGSGVAICAVLIGFVSGGVGGWFYYAVTSRWASQIQRRISSGFIAAFVAQVLSLTFVFFIAIPDSSYGGVKSIVPFAIGLCLTTSIAGFAGGAFGIVDYYTALMSEHFDEYRVDLS